MRRHDIELSFSRGPDATSYWDITRRPIHFRVSSRHDWKKEIETDARRYRWRTQRPRRAEKRTGGAETSRTAGQFHLSACSAVPLFLARKSGYLASIISYLVIGPSFTISALFVPHLPSFNSPVRQTSSNFLFLRSTDSPYQCTSFKSLRTVLFAFLPDTVFIVPTDHSSP